MTAEYDIFGEVLQKDIGMKPKFSGHDTFPLRYGWLHKAVNLLASNENLPRNADETARDAIVELGVGRNMVNAIKYWADMTGVLSTSTANGRHALKVTDLGKFIFDREGGIQSGVDPYLEDIGSIWLIHFHLNFDDRALTSYRYFFNFCNYQSFEKTKLIDEVYTSAASLTGLEPGKKSTIKKDVDCFLQSYITKSRLSRNVDEDHFSSPLAELGLIREISNGYLVSELSERRSLPPEIFAYALCSFIEKETKESKVNFIDFDSLLSKPGSPGRIFRMSEPGLSIALDKASKISNGAISWTDSLGLRQIVISESLKTKYRDFVESYYGNGWSFYD